MCREPLKGSRVVLSASPYSCFKESYLLTISFVALSVSAAVRSHPGSHLSLMLCFYKHPMLRASKARSVQKAIISFIDRMTPSHPINKPSSMPVRASPEVKPSLFEASDATRQHIPSGN